ncbi:hypothetical protein N7474_008998, partial [Penicillium riverlandense]|uniref:uncharacterized protein n=1 Tax=Penicillium riverlandense TaxID=1903569 RepID=UPI002546FFED
MRSSRDEMRLSLQSHNTMVTLKEPFYTQVKKWSEYKSTLRHFRKKHLDDRKCLMCKEDLLHEMHLRRHAEMGYASSQAVLPIVVFHGPNLDKTKTNVYKIIVLVRTTITIKMWCHTKINSVGVDQLVDLKRSSGEAKHGQNLPHVLNVFFVDTAQCSH